MRARAEELIHAAAAARAPNLLERAAHLQQVPRVNIEKRSCNTFRAAEPQLLPIKF